MVQEMIEIQKTLKDNPLLCQVMKIAKEIGTDKIQETVLRISKGELKDMKTDDIKIFQCFRENPPKPEKILEKEKYFNETGLLQSQIILDGNNYLIDGFTSYLLAIKNGIEYLPVQYGKRQIVWCYHKKEGKLYAWEVPGILVGHVSTGDKLVVETSRGLRTVRVALVEECTGQEPGTYKRVIRKRKRGKRGVTA